MEKNNLIVVVTLSMEKRKLAKQDNLLNSVVKKHSYVCVEMTAGAKKFHDNLFILCTYNTCDG